MKTKKRIFSLIKIGISCITMAYIIKMVNFSQIKTELEKANTYWFVTAITTLFIVTLIQSYRWKILLITEQNFSFRRLFKFTYIGYFGSLFMPSGIGGDILISILFGNLIKKTSIISISIAIGRFMGLFAQFSYFFIGIILVSNTYLPNNLNTITSLFFGLGLISLPTSLYFFLKLGSRYHRIKEKSWFLYTRKTLSNVKVMFSACVLSFVVQFLMILNLYFSYKIVNVEIPLIYFLIYSPILFFLTALPISINGLGIREGVNIFLFSLVPGVSYEQCLSVNIILIFLQLILSLIGGIFFLIHRKKSTS